MAQVAVYLSAPRASRWATVHLHLRETCGPFTPTQHESELRQAMHGHRFFFFLFWGVAFFGESVFILFSNLYYIYIVSLHKFICFRYYFPLQCHIISSFSFTYIAIAVVVIVVAVVSVTHGESAFWHNVQIMVVLLLMMSRCSDACG